MQASIWIGLSDFKVGHQSKPSNLCSTTHHPQHANSARAGCFRLSFATTTKPLRGIYDTLGVQPCRICCSRVQAMDSSSPTRRNLLHCAGSTEQKTPSQEACIGNQTGGRVWLVLETSDFWGDYEAMQVAGVRFSEVPRT
ncbi:hypothetical protein B5M09_002822 [Aphanomyces astaci]|uniref:Uncharacterized protein n=1 Tax=Aphanomyces astaci TaxID=112090 RepID=A0A425CXV6_APHAT|nr:hypothetical protein B5M09_002822 [Aphanomyces astaci]